MSQAQQLVCPEKLPKTYGGLVALCVPRPIHDTVSYENAVALIDALAVGKLNQDQEDYLEIMSQLVEAYENQHVKPPRLLTGVALVRALLEENELTGEDLAEILKVDRSVAFKVLKGTRNLTADHVRTLAKRFFVSADALLS